MVVDAWTDNDISYGQGMNNICFLIAAREFGFEFYKRTQSAIFIRERCPRQVIKSEFQVLNLLEFTSKRKQMFDAQPCPISIRFAITVVHVENVQHLEEFQGYEGASFDPKAVEEMFKFVLLKAVILPLMLQLIHEHVIHREHLQEAEVCVELGVMASPVDGGHGAEDRSYLCRSLLAMLANLIILLVSMVVTAPVVGSFFCWIVPSFDLLELRTSSYFTWPLLG